jgi:hypothetical protein
MKHLEFQNLKFNKEISLEIKEFLDYRDSRDIKCFNIEEVVFNSDVKVLEYFQLKFVNQFKEIIWFTFLYIYNMFYGNSNVDNSFKYKINVNFNFSFKQKKVQIFYYVDNEIFGIVVGTKFKNIRSFIQMLFPIISKFDLDLEFRFFPIT